MFLWLPFFIPGETGYGRGDYGGFGGGISAVLAEAVALAEAALQEVGNYDKRIRYFN